MPMPQTDFSTPALFNERTSRPLKIVSCPRFLQGHEMWTASSSASPTSVIRKINAATFARIRYLKSSGTSFCEFKSFPERLLNSYRERSSSSQILPVEASRARFSVNAVAALGRNLTTLISKLSFVCGVLFRASTLSQRRAAFFRGR